MLMLPSPEGIQSCRTRSVKFLGLRYKYGNAFYSPLLEERGRACGKSKVTFSYHPKRNSDEQSRIKQGNDDILRMQSRLKLDIELG